MPRDSGLRPTPEITDHSHYAREILGSVPRWSVRWGTSIVCAAVAVMIFLAWWIRYPETLAAQVSITSPEPPARVVARTSGKLVRVRVEDQQRVEAGTLLAVLESPGNPDTLIALQEQLTGTDSLSCKTAWHSTPNLGAVQEAYAAYQARCTEYLDYLIQDAVTRQQEALAAEQRETSVMLDIQTRQLRTFEERAALIQRDLRRMEKLRASGTVPEKALDDKRGELLEIRRAKEQLQAEIASTRVDATRLQRDVVSLATADAERRQSLRTQVEEAYQKALASLAQWEQDYTLRAPIAGRVSFFDYWSTSQVVAAGDEVMTIVPLGVEKAVGKLRVPLGNAGKLAVGQPVHIRLDAYPYEEYGLLRGKVQRISLVPRQRSFAVEVELPMPLVTSSGKPLALMQDMEGQADIITQDTRLLERLFRAILAPLRETVG